MFLKTEKFDKKLKFINDLIEKQGQWVGTCQYLGFKKGGSPKMITVLHFICGGGPPNDYNWLHRVGRVWKKAKNDYIIYEQPLKGSQTFGEKIKNYFKIS